MLELVRAVQFIKQMGSGRNQPLLFGCEETAGGDLIEVVVKLSSPQCGVGGLVREAFGALVASDLELPIPRPLLVVLEDGLIEAVEETVPTHTVTAIKASRFPTFGCQLVGVGASTFSVGRTISPQSELEAAEIFAFDALILNPDRRAGNPNLLYDARNFVIFDHELALNCAGVGGLLNPAPWQPHSLTYLTQGESQHVLYRGLLNKQLDFAPLQQKWSALNAARLAEYAAALPTEWADHDTIIDEIIQYLSDVHANLESALAEVQRVLQ